MSARFVKSCTVCSFTNYVIFAMEKRSIAKKVSQIWEGVVTGREGKGKLKCDELSQNVGTGRQ